jgi:hypothetical protein
MAVLATYLPQAMIIRMSAALPVYDHAGNVLQFPTPAAFGFFSMNIYIFCTIYRQSAALLPSLILLSSGAALELPLDLTVPALVRAHCQRTRCNT